MPFQSNTHIFSSKRARHSAGSADRNSKIGETSKCAAEAEHHSQPRQLRRSSMEMQKRGHFLALFLCGCLIQGIFAPAIYARWKLLGSQIRDPRNRGPEVSIYAPSTQICKFAIPGGCSGGWRVRRSRCNSSRSGFTTRIITTITIGIATKTRPTAAILTTRTRIIVRTTNRATKINRITGTGATNTQITINHRASLNTKTDRHTAFPDTG
jgi:hypothetical protein